MAGDEVPRVPGGHRSAGSCIHSRPRLANVQVVMCYFCKYGEEYVDKIWKNKKKLYESVGLNFWKLKSRRKMLQNDNNVYILMLELYACLRDWIIVLIIWIIITVYVIFGRWWFVWLKFEFQNCWNSVWWMMMMIIRKICTPTFVQLNCPSLLLNTSWDKCSEIIHRNCLHNSCSIS